MTVWSLWKSQNTKLWEAFDTTPASIVTRAKDTLNEWSLMQRSKLPLHEAEAYHNWSKSPAGMIKCNVDTAAFNNNAIMGYDMCFRDSTGLLLLGKSDYFHSSTTVLEAKTIGLLEAIKVAISNGMHVVLFERDCKSLLDAIFSTKVPLNEFGDLVSQCRSLLLNRPNFVVSHVWRQANRVAHCIARTSLSHPNPHIFNYVPTTLYLLIMNGMN